MPAIVRYLSDQETTPQDSLMKFAIFLKFFDLMTENLLSINERGKFFQGL